MTPAAPFTRGGSHSSSWQGADPLTGRRFGPVHVVLGRPSEDPEQWQVVSNEPTSVETFGEYGERFQIEEGFLDEKSGLFELESSKLRDAKSLERLVMVISVATLLLVSEALDVVERGDRRVVNPHWQRGLSYLKIGHKAVSYASVPDTFRGVRLGRHQQVDQVTQAC